jgi:hypothetical protein
LFVNDPDIGGQLVVVKVLPPGDTAPRAHRRAIREAPEKFKVRLVRQIFEPYAMPPPGGVLTFQGLAGGSAEWRPLADLPAEHIPAACAFLTRSLIAEWNPRFGVQKVGIVDFLRREIGVEGSSATASRGARNAAVHIVVRSGSGSAAAQSAALLVAGVAVRRRARRTWWWAGYTAICTT